MDFRLDHGQLELQSTVSRFFADRFPLGSVAARELVALDRELWRELADLGVFGLLVPEEAGGVGLGVVEAAIVFEQAGSHLVSGLLLWTTLAAGEVAGAIDGTTVVGGVAHMVGGVAHMVGGVAHMVGGVAHMVGGVAESGVAAATVPAGVAVEHAGDLDALVVLGDDAITVHQRDELGAMRRLDALDPLTPMGWFDALGPGTVLGGPAEAARWRLVGTVLAAAAASGVAARALEVARAYALEREQFGVPIGSFQAVKHLLADMYVRSEMAQSATYAAAAMVDGADDHAPRAAASAKLLAGDAALTNAATSVQVLGGMGFTWDMLPNYLVKRAWLLEQSFGTVDEHAAWLGAQVVAP